MRSVKYHTSWDWLMEAVEKIESLDCVLEVQMFRNCCRVRPDMFHDFLIPSIESTKQEAVWVAVVKFIQWYNEHKK
jgi:hypothetical protein